MQCNIILYIFDFYFKLIYDKLLFQTVLMQDKKGVKICVNCQQEGANATSSMETEDPQQIVGHKLPERMQKNTKQRKIHHNF